MNQGRTKDEPKNAEIENVLFIKISSFLKRLTHFLIWLTLLLKNNPRLDNLHQKNRTKKRFFLLISKYFCTFAPESTLEGNMSYEKYFVLVSSKGRFLTY